MKTFYWYDFETFGLNWNIDRPSQFAGVRTDADLNVIGDPDVWYCRPEPGYLPDPASCLVTGITPQTAVEKGVDELEFARRIFECFNRPGTVSIGYNTEKFDEHVVRFLFWRNLLDPYSHNFKDDCSRWDLLPLVRAVWALRPDNITWPDREDGTGKSFRLEHLSAANGLVHEHAHDAASDVFATIALARLIRERVRRLWDWAEVNRGKNQVFQALNTGKPCLWIDSYAGQERGFIRIVRKIANLPMQKNKVLVWDLRDDPRELLGMEPDDIHLRVFQSREEEQENGPRLALRDIKINAQPFVCSQLKVLQPEVCRRFGIDFEQIQENERRLDEILGKITDPAVEGYSMNDVFSADMSESDCEAALYSSAFASDDDRIQMNRVHRMSPEELAQAVKDDRIEFSDLVFHELLFRFRARSYPQTLTAKEKRKIDDCWRSRLQKGFPKDRSLGAYMSAIRQAQEQGRTDLAAGTLAQDRFDRNSRILAELAAWGEQASKLYGVDFPQEQQDVA
jgi:exodeoxyribonuclease-1